MQRALRINSDIRKAGIKALNSPNKDLLRRPDLEWHEPLKTKMFKLVMNRIRRGVDLLWVYRVLNGLCNSVTLMTFH